MGDGKRARALEQNRASHSRQRIEQHNSSSVSERKTDTASALLYVKCVVLVGGGLLRMFRFSCTASFHHTALCPYIALLSISQHWIPPRLLSASEAPAQPLTIVASTVHRPSCRPRYPAGFDRDGYQGNRSVRTPTPHTILRQTRLERASREVDATAASLASSRHRCRPNRLSLVLESLPPSAPTSARPVSAQSVPTMTRATTADWHTTPLARPCCTLETCCAASSACSPGGSLFGIEAGWSISQGCSARQLCRIARRSLRDIALAGGGP